MSAIVNLEFFKTLNLKKSYSHFHEKSDFCKFFNFKFCKFVILNCAIVNL